MRAEPAVLSVRRLQVHYPLIPSWPWQPGGIVRAVNDLQFDLRPGEGLGVVGEAGAGKSTLARVLAGLQSATAGGIVFQGREAARLDEAGWRAIRRGIQIVTPQDLLAPRQNAAASVEEPLLYLRPELDADARALRVSGVLDSLGVPPEVAERLPRDLAPAERMRVAIARALAPEPSVLVCDDLFPGLDPADVDDISAQLAHCGKVENLALVVLARDLEAVRTLCQRVLVMYMGRLMEQASLAELLARPRHPYTRMLLEPGAREAAGEIPNPAEPPSGCVFRTRCEMVDSLCAREVPHLRKAGASHAACHFVADAEGPT